MQDSLEELKQQVQNFCEARDWDQFHSPKELAIGLVTEASELLEIFRFQTPEQVAAMMQDPEARENMSDELADTLFFVLRFAQLYGFDLKQCVNQKIQKTESKYPVEQFKGSNQKYNR